MPNPSVPDVPPAAALPDAPPAPTPTRVVGKPLKAAPIKAPTDREPPPAQPLTPPVAGPLKADDSRITDRSGTPLAADAVFVDEGANRAVAAVRIYEEYVLGGTRTRSVRLAFSEGTTVHRDEADAIRARCRLQAEVSGTAGQ